MVPANYTSLDHMDSLYLLDGFVKTHLSNSPLTQQEIDYSLSHFF